MQYRPLPQSELHVSAVALGCWAFAGGGDWGPQDDADSINTVRAALSHGITFFDTAEAYGDGHSEHIVGQALKGRRNEAVIATKPKPGRATPEELLRACDESLSRLQTDYIDLYQQHWPSRKVPLAETIGGFERLREAGKIRAYGVCNYGPSDLDELLSLATPSTNQLAYSLVYRAIEFTIQPKCVENGIGILCYSPMAQGLLTGKYRSADEVPEGRARTKHFSGSRPQARHGGPGAEEETFATIEAIRRLAERHGTSMSKLALGWLLTRPAITAVLAGARTPDQLAANAAAGEGSLSDELVAALTEASEGLKVTLGADPDPWDSRIS